MGTKTKVAVEPRMSSAISIVCGLLWPVCCNKAVITRHEAYQVFLLLVLIVNYFKVKLT